MIQKGCINMKYEIDTKTVYLMLVEMHEKCQREKVLIKCFLHHNFLLSIVTIFVQIFYNTQQKDYLFILTLLSR